MKYLLCILAIAVTAGCSTTASFRVPEGADLYVHEKLVPKENHKHYKTYPYSWGTAGGIRYRIEKDGKMIETGTLKSRFRVISIFWPPAAVIYWPMGFSGEQGWYDFTEKNRFVRPRVPLR